MLENTDDLSLRLSMAFILFSFIGGICILKNIQNENIDKIIDIWKWFIGTIAISLLAAIINDGFRERDQDIKETEIFEKYVDTILAADGLEKRKLLSEYFAIVSPNGSIKNAWIDYNKIVNTHLNEDKKDREKLEAIIDKVNSNGAVSKEDLKTRDKLEERISIRNESLAPSISRNEATPKVFIHIGSESQRSNMVKLQESIKRIGFLTPGIELIDKISALPLNPNVRYFNEEDTEAAIEVVEQLKAIGYSTAYPYRVKHLKARSGTLEVWLTAK